MQFSLKWLLGGVTFVALACYMLMKAGPAWATFAVATSFLACLSPCWLPFTPPTPAATK